MGRVGIAVFASALCCLGAADSSAQGQYPLLDRVAGRVVQKYQTSSCEQLAAERAHPPAGQREEMEQRVIRLLHEDPQMRQAFIDRVAAPIANKLFECGLIP
jgi:glucose dehydrogenase